MTTTLHAHRSVYSLISGHASYWLSGIHQTLSAIQLQNMLSLFLVMAVRLRFILSYKIACV